MMAKGWSFVWSFNGEWRRKEWQREGGSSMGLGGANTVFSITSVRLRVLHDPNEDRNMREIRSLRRLWFSMANSE